jgi:hypothetical protein
MAKRLQQQKGPPPQARKWMEEFRQGKHQGIKPTPAHFQSIWDTNYIPDRCIPARRDAIAETEQRLGIVIPASLKEQLLVQNGGYLKVCDKYPFEHGRVYWTNATVDGIDQVDSWHRADDRGRIDSGWFDDVDDVEGLDLLIKIASHSESQLCLDYRKVGGKGMPGVTYIDVCQKPTQVVSIAGTVHEFILALVAAPRRVTNSKGG